MGPTLPTLPTLHTGPGLALEKIKTRRVIRHLNRRLPPRTVRREMFFWNNKLRESNELTLQTGEH